eukprot:Sspe_Gene.12439::Locus_4241_Transcript_1_1_Confidence_1.000_Length_2908::g.12439::m.12439/K12619/XRN2, RAT1; 5'-3' exoribonuclease 2
MGIPAFYSWLWHKYARITKRNLREFLAQVDNLYLDMNGILHPACQGPGGAYLDDEEVMLAKVVEYLDFVVRTAQPRKLVYLAVDGVAPRAKLNQQRARRFQAAKGAEEVDADFQDLFGEEEQDHLMKEETEKELTDVKKGLKLGIFASLPGEQDDSQPPAAELSGDNELFAGLASLSTEDKDPQPAAEQAEKEKKWNSNAITPGTAFMAKVAAKLRQWADANSKDFTVIVSDAFSPGEGEHKFFDFIRREKAAYTEKKGGSWFSPNDSHVFVSSDADIILLSLSLHLPKVVVMREDRRAVPDQNGPKFEYLSIAALREHLAEELIGKSSKYYFARSQGPTPPRSPSCSPSRTPGSTPVATPLQSRKSKATPESFPSCPPVPEGGSRRSPNTSPTLPPVGRKVDPDYERLLDDFICLCTLVGNDFLPHLPSAYVGQLTLDVLIDLYCRVIAQFDMRDEGYLVASDGTLQLAPLQKLLQLFAITEDAIFRQERVYDKVLSDTEAIGPLGCDLDEQWRKIYYESVMELSSFDSEPCDFSKVPDMRKAMARDWLDGLCWVNFYYRHPGCLSWGWHYHYYHAPFALDLVRCLDEMLEAGATGQSLQETLSNDASEPLKPFEQLLAVLPSSSFDLLPNGYRVVASELSFYYPTRWRVDLTGAKAEYHGVVILPFMDIPRMVESAKQVPDGTPEEQDRNQNRMFEEVFAGPEVNPSGMFAGQITQMGRAVWKFEPPHIPVIPAAALRLLDGTKLPPVTVVERPAYIPWASGFPGYKSIGWNRLLNLNHPIARLHLALTVAFTSGMAVSAPSLCQALSAEYLCFSTLALACGSFSYTLMFGEWGRETPQALDRKKAARKKEVSPLEFFRPKRCRSDWVCSSCLSRNFERLNDCFRCKKQRSERSDLPFFLPKEMRWSQTCYAADRRLYTSGL